MKKKITKKSMVLVTLACLAIAGTASAGFMLSHKDRADIAVMVITKKLDLNENQVAKLEDIKKEFEKVHAEHAQERAEKVHMIIEMVKSDQIDQSQVIALMNDKIEMLEEKAPIFIEKIAEFHRTLSAEQKQIIVEMIEKRHKHF